MPKPSTGYEVVHEPIISSTPTFNAPTDTFIVNAFVTRNSDGKMLDTFEAVDIAPGYDINGDWTSVTLFSNITDGSTTLVLVCVGK